MDSGEHVAYLGAFVVQGALWRGDLFQGEDGRFVAEHTVTQPDGSWATALHSISGDDKHEAIETALADAFAYFESEGADLEAVTVIHRSTGAAPTLH